MTTEQDEVHHFLRMDLVGCDFDPLRMNSMLAVNRRSLILRTAVPESDLTRADLTWLFATQLPVSTVDEVYVVEAGV